MKKIFNWGISSDFEDYKNQAIAASNKLAFAFTVFGFFLLVASVVFEKQFILLSSLWLVFSVSSFALNYYGVVNVSRFLLLTGSVLILSLAQGLAAENAAYLYHFLYILLFSFLFIPFLIVDFRESTLLAFTSVVGLIFFVWRPFVEGDSGGVIMAGESIAYIFSAFYLLIFGYALFNFRYSIEENDTRQEEVLAQAMEKSRLMENKQRELQQRIREIEETHAIEEKRSWVAQGVSQMIDLMRSNRSDLYAQLIEEIVKYLNASVGAIYSIRDEEFHDKELVMEGCYAFDRKKSLKFSVPYGDGIVGQSCLDSELLFLENIPPSFLTIRSGLGDAPPKYLAVVPLMEEGNIAGVLEIASHNPFQENQREFLRELSVSIASFILTKAVNEKISDLIEQNQQQAEEMKAQEEEMMQNIEELHATQEEMARKEKEYISKIEWLEKQLKNKEIKA